MKRWGEEEKEKKKGQMLCMGIIMVHDNTHGRLKFTTGEAFSRLVVCKVHFMLLKGTYTLSQVYFHYCIALLHKTVFLK